MRYRHFVTYKILFFNPTTVYRHLLERSPLNVPLEDWPGSGKYGRWVERCGYASETWLHLSESSDGLKLIEPPPQKQVSTEPGSGYRCVAAFFVWAGCPIAGCPIG